MACIMAIAAATPKAITATQMCATTRRFAGWAIVTPGSGPGTSTDGRVLSSVAMGGLARVDGGGWRPPLRPRDDVQLGHHRVVGDAAVLVAGDQVLARSKLGGELADVPRDHHRLAIGAHDLEAVRHVRGGEMERHRRVGG